MRIKSVTINVKKITKRLEHMICWGFDMYNDVGYLGTKIVSVVIHKIQVKTLLRL